MAEARRELVRSFFGPSVVVITSPDADAACRKNSLSLSDLLLPFACARFSAPNGSGFMEMHLRFQTLADLASVDPRDAERSMINSVSDVYFDLPDLDAELAKPFSIDPTVWFDAYRRSFFKHVGPSDHEFFNHPVACIAAVSTAHDNPLQALSSLYSMSEPPAQFTEQKIDPNIRKFHLLIHDNATGSPERAESLLQQGKGLFGEKLCHMLVINSNQDPEGDSMIVPDLWTELVGPLNPRPQQQGPPPPEDNESPPQPTEPDAPASPAAMFDPLSQPMERVPTPQPQQKRYGSHLSDQDLDRIRKFVDFFASSCVYQYLQETVYRLNAHVASSRKGLSRSLFSATKKWFGSGSSSPKSPAQGQSPGKATEYAYHSQEAQMRRLGDYAFMLQDYELAYNTYHNVKKDFNSDKAWKYLAGTQEMLGLCLFMQDKRQNEDNHRFESAIVTYSSKCNATIYACRTTLLAAEMMLSKGLFREAGTAYIRMTGEDSDLRSAIFLEQASVCFLQSTPSMPRRAAFHLILAGHRYTKCGLRVHSLRCYVQALRLYKGCDWDLAEDHMYFTIGRQAYQLNMVEQALASFSKLLNSHRQLTGQQRQHIKEFVHVFKQYSEQLNASEAKEIPLPVIDPKSIQVFLRPAAAPSTDPANEASPRLSESRWRDLEQKLLHSQKRPLSRTRSNSLHCLDDASDNSMQPICVVGEPIRVQFTLVNQLSIPIDLRNVRLRCKVPAPEGSSDEPLANVQDSDDEIFAVEEKDMVIVTPHHRRVVELSVTPRREGSFEICGIDFHFAGIDGYRAFNVKGRRLNSNRKERLGVFYSKDRRLNPKITKAMPLLNVRLTGLENAVYSSQLVSAMLVIENNGASPLVGLHAATNLSGRMIIGSHQDMDSRLYPSVGADGEGEISLKNVPSGVARAVMPLRFNDSDKLDVGCKAAVPVWFWAGQPGTQDIHLLFYYTAEDPSTELPYRMLRHSVRCKVLPSLLVNTMVHRYPHEFDKVFLRLTTDNVHNASCLRIKQICCHSKGWKLRSLCSTEPTSASGQFVLNPRESLSLHVQLEADDAATTGRGELSSIAFGGAATAVTHPPAGSFYSRALIKDHESTADNKADDKLRLLVLWDAPQSGEAGQAFVSQLVSSTVAGEGRIHDNHSADVHFILRHADQVFHDFAQEPMLELQASLVLRNYSVGSQLICVELLPPWSKSHESGHSSAPFVWVGKTTFRVRLEEKETLALELKAAITAPAIIDLSRLRVSLPESPDVAVRTPWHSHVCVENKPGASS